jgi:hypothetical protein
LLCSANRRFDPADRGYSMSVTELTLNVQRKLGLKIDGVAGPKTWAAIDAAIPDPVIIPKSKLLIGDGTWPFQAYIDGDDICVDDIVITCFGGWGDGESDPQDDGRTASGMNTRTQSVVGVSIAMDGRMFRSLTPAVHAALDGAPIPRLMNSVGLTAWHTPVKVTIDNQTFTPRDGIVDLGPGKQASKNGAPHALDLTVLAARVFDTKTPIAKLASQFERKGSFRIIGGAKLLPVGGNAV